MARGTVMLASALAGLVLAACGGDPRSSAPSTAQTAITDRELRANVTEALDSRNAAATCALFSDRLLKRMYRSARKCRSSTRDEQESLDFLEFKEVVKPLAASVDGNDARVRVSIAYNGHAFEGHVRMRKTNAEWRLDDIEIDLIRASYADDAQLRALDEVIPGTYSAKAQQCYRRPYDAMSDQEFRRVFYANARGDSAESDKDLRHLAACLPRTAAGVSFPRALFELGLRKGLASEGIDAVIVTCAIKQLRNDVRDKVFDDSLEAGFEDLPPSVERSFTKAMRSCARGTT